MYILLFETVVLNCDTGKHKIILLFLRLLLIVLSLVTLSFDYSHLVDHVGLSVCVSVDQSLSEQ